MTTFENATIEIEERRWEVVFRITPEGREPVILIASADSALTDHDGVFFGTPADKEEKLSW